MKNNIWNKRIPTLLGIGMIGIGIIITSLLVKSGVIFISRAGPSQTPTDVRISNIQDSSFSVSYTTEDQVIGSINFGDSKNLGQSALDNRDQQTGSVSPHRIHNITVRGLNPSTKYYFSILSGQNTFLNNNSLFEAFTARAIDESPSQQTPLSGKIILPNGTIPSEAIIYVTSENAQVISALVKQDGSYMLPLNSLLNKDLSGYFAFQKNTIIKLLVVGDSLRSNVLLSKDQINPIPTVTLSNDYDFTIGSSPTKSQSATSVGFPSFSSQLVSSSSANQSPQILAPKKDEGFTDNKPLFKGNALPNEKVQIIIHSDEQIQTEVKADANGNWTYRPSAPLSPGNHTISIVSRDKSGILKTIQQSFVVYASGTQVNQSATPSATPILTSVPNPTSIPISTISIIPTSVPSSMIPSPTKIPLPAAGNSSVIFLGMGAAAATIFGLLFFLLVH
ncbi:MAG: Ig-like domain-containing protein [Candidatus Levybacteria bacterium]|nr:Ig-like domain-containing protein [Candidatus Levybacteria bacterium]